MPAVARAVGEFLNIGPLQWNDPRTLLLDHKINPYKHLMARVDPKQMDALFESLPTQQAGQSSAAGEANASGSRSSAPTPPANGASPISIDDFKKVDLRVARIVDA